MQNWYSYINYLLFSIKKQRMKKAILLLFISLLITSISRAQVSGSSLLCPGFVYTYTANISGAVTYTWTPPQGWLIISGQGTSQVQMMCNENEGDICADAYDGGGIFIAQNCLTANWGGDGTGWDAIKNAIGSCICSPYSISVQSNGGSSPCGGCGSGTLSSNLVYGVYDQVLPGGSFLGIADGVTAYYPNDTAIVNLYVYSIDTTLGLSNAIQITGGNCATTINNNVQLFPCSPPTIVASVLPSPVCLGDTFTIEENSGLGTFPSYLWQTSDANLTFTSANGSQTIDGIYSGGNPGSPIVNFTATDIFGCYYTGQVIVDVINCIAPPVASFSVSNSSICPNTCTDFLNLSTGATESHWTFYGAITDTSTLSDPPLVCYATPGDYNVQLIVSNGGGTDTLILTNYIHVYPMANMQNVTLVNDTLFAIQGFVTYQWFYNNSLIGGATDYFYPATLNGNYTVVSTDANGCESSFELQNIILNVTSINSTRFNIYPNPAIENFTIEKEDNSILKLELIDNLGNVVFVENLVDKINEIETKQLTSGIYIVRLSSDKVNSISKLTISK